MFVWKPDEEREGHDERRDAEQQPEERGERDDPHLRVAPRREEIAAGEKKEEKKVRERRERRRFS